MGPIILILISLGLAGGFLTLIRWEHARGVRVLALARTTFDREVERATFVLEHVDWNAYFRDEAKSLAIRAAHSIVRLSLQVVRAVERVLTETVRRLRSRVASEPPVGGTSTRPFVQALSGFKEELKASHPTVPEL